MEQPEHPSVRIHTAERWNAMSSSYPTKRLRKTWETLTPG